jgi:hypothetical protein
MNVHTSFTVKSPAGPIKVDIIESAFSKGLSWESLLISLKTGQGTLGTVTATSICSRIEREGELTLSTSSGVKYLIAGADAKRIWDACKLLVGEDLADVVVKPGRRGRPSPLASRTG